MVEPGTGKTVLGESREEHVEQPRRQKKSPFGRGVLGIVVGVFLGGLLAAALDPFDPVPGGPGSWASLAFLFAGALVGGAAGAILGIVVARRSGHEA